MPSIEVGASTPSRIYVGNTRINRVYLGQQIVWPAFDTPAGPKGCWVPVFQSLAGAPPQGHPDLCRDDLGMVGDIVSLQADDDAGTYQGFDEVTHASGYGIVSEPPAVDYAGGIVAMSTLRVDGSAANSIQGITIRLRRGNVLNGIVQQFTDDFYNNGYIGFFVTNRGDEPGPGRLVLHKASFGTRSSATSLTFSRAQLLAGISHFEDALGRPSYVFYRPPAPYGGETPSVGPLIAFDIIQSSHWEGRYRAVGFFTGLEATNDLRQIDEYEVGDDTPWPALYYGRDWTTYGLGEVARFLVGRTSDDTLLSSVYDPDDDGDTFLALGDTTIDSSLSVGRIQHVNGTNTVRMFMSSDSSGNIATYVNGAGANKSLYVACRGDIIELNLNFAQGFTGSALPDYQAGYPVVNSNANLIDWRLSDTQAAAAMRNHLRDFLRGDGYQVLFVIADSGTVQAVG